ncbi:unnamed protein product [Auanema sp. JU1783]|nr:unnamed protein product [Auanema sp. JU1783]
MLRPQNNRVYVVPICFTRRFLLFSLLLVGVPAFYYIVSNTASDNGYTESVASTRYSIEEMQGFAFKNSVYTNFRPSYYTRWDFSFNQILNNPVKKFNITKTDVIVFLHIQKTAGTSFEKYLVRYLELEKPCKCSKGRKRCTCRRPNNQKEIWLFSRYSTGWDCGLHADFTELYVSGCVDASLDKKEGSHKKRRYFYTSFLREPISRFISEYRHVNRGATWIASRHVCNGRPPTPDELPLCFDPQTGWDDVSLDEFLHCPYNLAFNRQTRMLADLTLVNCYSRTDMTQDIREKIMLESAKNNLRKLAYFGLKEKMDDSQYMFEKLFGLTFTKQLSEWSKSKSNDTVITENQLKLIKERNHLDIALYEYAVKLFESRMSMIRNKSMDTPDVTRKLGVKEETSESFYFLRDKEAPEQEFSSFMKSNNTVQYDANTDSYEIDDSSGADRNENVLFKRV